MVEIKIKKGLDIPLTGKPQGQVRLLTSEVRQIALDVREFSDLKLKLLVKEGDFVKLGTPLLEDKDVPGRYFVSPAGGVISGIRRGEKRALLDLIIDVDPHEESLTFRPFDPLSGTRDEIIQRLMEGGGFTHIKKRPFSVLADPKAMPRSIFIKAIESLPLNPPAELQVAGHEELFQAGINGLKKLTNGPVHLVYRKGSKAFLDVKNCVHHTAEGPHPISNPSLHIQNIDPIESHKDIVWTLTAHDVLVIGSLIIKGIYFTSRVMGIGGPACLEDRTGFFVVREGCPIKALITDRLPHEEGPIRIVSGDILVGHKVEPDDFLGFDDYALSIIRESVEREFLHFFRLGTNKYSFSHAYLSGFLNPKKQTFDFTTNLHGEKRPFIEPSLYDKVQPLQIPTLPLVKALLSEDYELAEKLGLLEVDPEDFALPTFVDPSKIEMVSIVKQGLKNYSKEFN